MSLCLSALSLLLLLARSNAGIKAYPAVPLFVNDSGVWLF